MTSEWAWVAGGYVAAYAALGGYLAVLVRKAVTARRRRDKTR
jgi:hypothetical protein